MATFLCPRTRGLPEQFQTPTTLRGTCGDHMRTHATLALELTPTCWFQSSSSKAFATKQASSHEKEKTAEMRWRTKKTHQRRPQTIQSGMACSETAAHSGFTPQERSPRLQTYQNRRECQTYPNIRECQRLLLEQICSPMLTERVGSQAMFRFGQYIIDIYSDSNLAKSQVLPFWPEQLGSVVRGQAIMANFGYGQKITSIYMTGTS